MLVHKLDTAKITWYLDVTILAAKGQNISVTRGNFKQKYGNQRLCICAKAGLSLFLMPAVDLLDWVCRRDPKEVKGPENFLFAK